MEKEFDFADFGQEFGPNGIANAMNGRGGDNTEYAANKARAAKYSMSESAAKMNQSTAEVGKKNEVTNAEPKGGRWTKSAETSPNEAGK